MPVRAWDVKGYRSSNGLLNPAVVKVMSERPAQIAAQTRRNYPAPIAILDCLFQGMLLPFDKALQLESKAFRATAVRSGGQKPDSHLLRQSRRGEQAGAATP